MKPNQDVCSTAPQHSVEECVLNPCVDFPLQGPPVCSQATHVPRRLSDPEEWPQILSEVAESSTPNILLFAVNCQSSTALAMSVHLLFYPHWYRLQIWNLSLLIFPAFCCWSPLLNLPFVILLFGFSLLHTSTLLYHTGRSLLPPARKIQITAALKIQHFPWTCAMKERGVSQGAR